MRGFISAAMLVCAGLTFAAQHAYARSSPAVPAIEQQPNAGGEAMWASEPPHGESKVDALALQGETFQTVGSKVHNTFIKGKMKVQIVDEDAEGSMLNRTLMVPLDISLTTRADADPGLLKVKLGGQRVPKVRRRKGGIGHGVVCVCVCVCTVCACGGVWGSDSSSKSPT